MPVCLSWTQSSLHHQTHDRGRCLGHAGAEILPLDQTSSVSDLANAKYFKSHMEVKHNMPLHCISSGVVTGNFDLKLEVEVERLKSVV